MEASIVVPEPFQHHFSSYHGPRRGFLDLPPELRDIIYDLTLTVGDPKDHDIYLGKTPIFKADAPTSEELCGRPLRYQLEGVAVAILRVNKQVHYEAARFFYGKNVFVVPIGLDGRKCHRRSDVTPDNINNNFMNLPHHYLRMVQKCVLRILLPHIQHKWSKHFYLKAKERITYFADAMHGREHSLKKLVIIFATWPQQNRYPRKRFSSQNVLEPLGTVHGIPEVAIVGVGSEFMVKLKSALSGEKITCSPAQETYGTRNVKVRGRRRLQKYKLGRYYDSKYNWTQTDPPLQT